MSDSGRGSCCRRSRSSRAAPWAPYVGSIAALLAGIAIPLAAREVIGGGRTLAAEIILLAIGGGLLLRDW